MATTTENPDSSEGVRLEAPGSSATEIVETASVLAPRFRADSASHAHQPLHGSAFAHVDKKAGAVRDPHAQAAPDILEPTQQTLDAS